MNDFEEYPQIIYKYRNWKDEWHKNILLKNQLFLSSPKDLNDPYDCKIPIAFDLLDTIEKKKAYAQKILNDHAPRLLQENVNLEKELIKIENALINDFDHYKKTHSQFHSDGLDKYFGVLSFSKKWNINLLWSNYSDSHKGFCIGFWEEKIRTSSLFGGGGPVSYFNKEKFPEIDPMKYDMKVAYGLLHLKSNDWEYEDEYRITEMFSPKKTIPSIEDRTITIPNDFFAEIVLGLNISKDVEETIINIAREKNIKIYKAYKIPNKIEFGREEIR